MGPHHGRIEHHPIQIGFLHGLEQALPTAFLRPAPTALAQRVVLAKAGWQRAPSAAVARHPEHGVEKEPVIDACSTNIAGFAREMRCQSGPRTVTDFIQIAHECKDNCPYNLV
jgi:hypothetical protein